MSETVPARPHSRAASYRPDIDGLRAVAVLLVVAFHAFPDFLGGGFAGVDVFFVISGYLITGILIDDNERGSFGFGAFYARRIRRIFPALIVVTGCCFVFGFAILPAREFRELSKHVAGGAGFAANFVQWSEAGYFDGASATKPLMHLWSLGIEEQFYMLWPPLLYLAHKRGWNLLRTMLAITVASFLFNIGEGSANGVADFYSPLARCWELAAGGILACLAAKPAPWFARIDRGKKDMGSAIGLGLILAAGFAFNQYDDYPGWRALAPVTGAALLLAAGSGGWVNRRILAHPAAVGIGLVSYPLYLWHWPLLSFLRIALSRKPEALLNLAAVIVSIILAALTYQLIEKPVRFGANRKAKTIALCLMMAAIGNVAAYQAFAGKSGPAFDSYPQRYQDQIHWGFWDDGDCTRKYGVSPCQANSDHPQILILGDSHGNHLYPGFALTVPKTDVLAVGGCPPLDGVFLHVRKNQELTPCDSEDFSTSELKLLKDNPGIKTAIVSARWRHLLAGYIQNQHERELWGAPWLSSNREGESRYNNIDLIVAGLARMFGELDALKLKIIYIRVTPELDPELNEYCGLMSQTPPADCFIPRQTYLEQRQPEDVMLARLRQKFPDLAVYDPIDALCDRDKCYFVRNNVLLFRDNHHLSVNGSVCLAKDIKGWMTRNGLLETSAQ